MNFHTANRLLKYDPETGVIFWRHPRKGIKPSGEAGTLNHRGYIYITVNGKVYQAHRIAYLLYYGKNPNQIDHINHNRIDNRIVNLRNANHKINAMNRTRQSNNTSGVSGVVFQKINSKWAARITHNNIFRYLGVFDDWFEAVCARKSAEHRYGFHMNHGKI